MSPTETARVLPSFGASELRIYRMVADEPGDAPDSSVWVNLSAECLSARCRLTPVEARQVAAGMLAAADAADSAGAPA